MVQFGANDMANQVAIPFFYNPDLAPDATSATQRAKCLPLSFNFNQSGSNASIQTYTATLQDIGLDVVQGIYVDAGNSPAPTSIRFNGTMQTITIPAYTQGYYRPLVGNQQLDFTITNYAASTTVGKDNIVSIIFLNIMPDTASTWTTNPQLGTPFAISAVTTNATCNCVAPSVPGRTTYVTTVTATATGSTSAVDGYLTVSYVDSNGANVNLQYTFVFPLGASAVAAQPLVLNFWPPLEAYLSNAFQASLPAGGPGNISECVTISGYIL
jgi:hypothetical protein